MRLAKILITIVPKGESSDQRKLYQYYCMFTKCQEPVNEIEYIGKDLWVEANKYILEIINNIISNEGTITCLSRSLSKKQDLVLEAIKFLVDKYSNEIGCIVPN